MDGGIEESDSSVVFFALSFIKSSLNKWPLLSGSSNYAGGIATGTTGRKWEFLSGVFPSEIYSKHCLIVIFPHLVNLDIYFTFPVVVHSSTGLKSCHKN